MEFVLTHQSLLYEKAEKNGITHFPQTLKHISL